LESEQAKSLIRDILHDHDDDDDDDDDDGCCYYYYYYVVVVMKQCQSECSWPAWTYSMNCPNLIIYFSLFNDAVSNRLCGVE
jgi:hypothetical protein